MVATPLMMQPNLPVELPKARTAEGKETDNVTITIAPDGQWALNEVRMSPDEMLPSLRRKLDESRDRYVIVRADRRTAYGTVQRALRLAKAAQARDLAIATEQKKAK